MNYKYIFSIVMAVYNCEPFLRETLDSVVNQKIDRITETDSEGNSIPVPIFESLFRKIILGEIEKYSADVKIESEQTGQLRFA